MPKGHSTKKAVHKIQTCAEPECANLLAVLSGVGGVPRSICSQECRSRRSRRVSTSRSRWRIYTCGAYDCSNLFVKDTNKKFCSRRCLKVAYLKVPTMRRCRRAGCHNLIVVGKGSAKCCSSKCNGFEHLMRTMYGITSTDYAALLDRQDNRCAICRRSAEEINMDRRLSVDHDHATGAVRGLLCHPCNSAIGLLQEDPAVLAAAIEYLRSAET